MIALKRCPFAPKGQRGAHDLSVIVPESDQHPLLLFCVRCGVTARHSIELPAPLDDLPADAIEQLVKSSRA